MYSLYWLLWFFCLQKYSSSWGKKFIRIYIWSLYKYLVEVDNIPKPSFKIENVVASVSLSQTLNLEKIAERVPNAEYSPEHPKQ